MPARKAPKTFAEARDRLDEILEALEREADDVDQLAARIQEASGLLRFCQDRLAKARQEVKEVVADLSAVPDPEAQAAGPAGGEAAGGAGAIAEDDDSVPLEAYEDDEEASGGGGNLPF